MKALWGLLAGVVLVAGCLCGLPLLAVMSLKSPAAACAPTGQTHPTGGPGALGRWDSRQMANASTVVAVGKELRIPARGWVVAVATTMQESSMLMYANDNPAYPLVKERSLALPHQAVGHDHDSVGLFQQRPSPPEGAGSWGTVAELMNAATSARKFYLTLQKVPGWDSMSIAEAAQRVQRSAFPDAYAKWESAAEQVVAAVAPDAATSGIGQCTDPCPPGVAASPAPPQAPGEGPCGMFTRAASWLTAWQGGPVPYLSSGNPSDWFRGYRRDCSGYVSMALGLSDPGLDTKALAAASTPIAKQDLKPGDLLINPPTGPDGHVVIFERWTDATRSSYWGYEQAGDGGTLHRSIPFPYFGTFPMGTYRYGTARPQA